MTEDAGNKALVRRFMDDFWDGGDLGVANGLFVAGEAAAVQGWAARLRASMPDLRVTTDYLVGEGDLVAVFSTQRGTYTGPATGPYVDLFTPSGHIEPMGNAVEVTGSFLFRVAGGSEGGCGATATPSGCSSSSACCPVRRVEGRGGRQWDRISTLTVRPAGIRQVSEGRQIVDCSAVCTPSCPAHCTDTG